MLMSIVYMGDNTQTFKGDKVEFPGDNSLKKIRQTAPELVEGPINQLGGIR